MSGLNFDPSKSTQTAELTVKQFCLLHGISDDEEIPTELLKDLLTALHSRSTSKSKTTKISVSAKEEAKTKLIAEVKKTNSDIDEVIYLIRKGAGANTVDPESNESVLQLACKKNDLQLIATLLEQGAGVLFKGMNGRTALHEAVRYSGPLTVDLLLEQGATRYISEPDDNGNTPNLEACKRNSNNDQIKILDTLLNNGASFLEKNNAGETSLILAIKQGNIGLIDLTLESGVDPNLVDKLGKTHFAMPMSNKMNLYSTGCIKLQMKKVQLCLLQLGLVTQH
jgi:ankyrin repeat protein